MKMIKYNHRSELRKYILYSSTLLMVWLALACTRERDVNEPVEGKAVGIEVEINVPAFGAFKDNDGLKAVENGDLGIEAQVKEIYLFYRPSDNADATLSKVVLDYASEPITSGLFSTRLKVDATGQYDFFAIANPTDVLKAQLNAVNNSTVLQDIIVSAGNDKEAFNAPFIMYGEAKNMTINSNVKVGIRLNRLVACIEVVNRTQVIDATSNQQAFTISSVQLFNGNNTSYLAPHVNTADNQYKTPTPASKYEGEVIQPNAEGILPAIYTFEAFNDDQITDDYDEDPTNDKSLYVVVHIIHNYYNNNNELIQEDFGYYRINVSDYRGRGIVCRNGIYFINLKNVYGKGYATVDEAKKNRASNIVLEYAKDADSFLFPSEDRYKYVITDGEYYLALTTDTLRLSRAPWLEKDDEEEPIYLNQFWIKTNAPSGKWSYSIDIDTSNAPDNWFRAKEMKPYGSGIVPGLLIYKDELLTKEGEFPEWYFIRYARLTIKVEGRPNLTVRIPVSQEMDDGFFNDIDADPSLHVTSGSQKEVFTSTIAATWENTEWFIYRIYDSEGNEDPNWLEVTVGSPSAGEYEYPNVSGVLTKYKYYQGKSRLTIIAHELQKEVFYREGYVVLKMIPFAGYLSPKTTTIRVISGLSLDYNIVYPDNEPKKRFLERKKRVIESSLYQNEPQTYKVNVNSTMKWHVVSSHPNWITVTQPEFNGGSYNDNFTVTIPVNDGTPVIGGLPPAREGYVDIVGDQFYRRIMVYQGGYVKIGNDVWMDRNLQISAYNGSTYAYTGDPYKLKRQNRNSGPLVLARDLLYAGAVPIAHPSDEPVIYAYGRLWGETSSEWTYGRITPIVPQDNYGRTKEEYLKNRPNLIAAIGSYNGYGKYTFIGNVKEANDGYFTWGMHGTFPCRMRRGAKTGDGNTVAIRYFYTAWNGSYIQGDGRNVMELPVSKGDLDPCPEGWRVPSYAEQFELTSYLKDCRHYSSGVEDYVPTNLESSVQSGNINNGLFFYNKDQVSCWFPFTGERDYNDLGANSFKIINIGETTAYWTNFSKDGLNAFRFSIHPKNAFFELWYADGGYPVRCVQDIDK